MMNYNLWY